MQILRVEPGPASKDFRPNKVLACAEHVSRMVTEPTRIEHATTGELIAVYGKLDDAVSTRELEAAVRTVNYTKSYRSTGMWTVARTFGFSPRVAFRRDFCCSSSLANEQPIVNATLCEWAKHSAALLKSHHAPGHAAQAKMVAEVLPEWRLPGDVFTSGIANWNNRIPYHRDQGNFANAWSSMIVLRKGMGGGGALVIPELDLALECGDRTYTLFNGAKWLHGVSPFEPIGNKKLAWRASIVWYALRDMKKCLCPEEELVRITTKRTALEDRKERIPNAEHASTLARQAKRGQK